MLEKEAYGIKVSPIKVFVSGARKFLCDSQASALD